MQMENIRLKDRNRLLEDETRELTQIVREHERALETVMDRFRTQTFMAQQAMSDIQRAHQRALLIEQKRNALLEREMTRLRSVLDHVTGRIRHAIHVQHTLDDEEQLTMAQLETENAQLRLLLAIAEDPAAASTHMAEHVEAASESEAEDVRAATRSGCPSPTAKTTPAAAATEELMQKMANDYY
ncbi:hypothetical protein SYNPS1DRAFT_28168 [Syncephalis pseudoplumigaleata]|uniref:Uncharacterized protein n=1 Tax=Syncephalis pseudoplumigaleata TaxID=1712513 RepID=A0A4P9Z0X7_9FUNG|nr:hypothetical protein SYNPS1DRAFT_28168 [Syncephalis pseudoplumigaleata]|eukprot:RKP26123.1 hypothetical protein SYNPS1DRAFT_28168 [Syncephalis pseudoplumigaleata]